VTLYRPLKPVWGQMFVGNGTKQVRLCVVVCINIDVLSGVPLCINEPSFSDPCGF